MYQVTNSFSTIDRFIPKRSNVNVEVSHYLLNKSSESSPETGNSGTPKYVNYAYLNWKKRIYQNRLWSILTPSSQKVLNISEPSLKKKSCGVINCQLWPVRPRKKPLIGAPSMVLDMPQLEGNICHHITDWGSKGYLASVFEQEIYLWHPNTNVPFLVTNTGGRVENCVRWNRSSTHFAIALNMKGIAVWDCVKNQISHQTVCTCQSLCTTTSLEWSSNNLLVSGCSLGRLSLWSPVLKLLNTIYPAHSGIIITIAFSSAEHYLATSATDGAVRIWFWPNIKEHFEINYSTPVRGVAWHPWRDSLFAVGGNIGEGSLTLWNASNQSQIGYKPPPDNNSSYFVDNLTWSTLTGELVVSYWQQQERSRSSLSNGKNFIVILSNLETEVDAIEWHVGRVLYLLWGGDGTKLGTAGTDENLCVWDFLGNSTETIKARKRANKKRKFTTNGIENLTLFGQCIR